MLRIVSWNVNGIRAVLKKGFQDWLNASGADIIGIQEIKATADQIKEEAPELFDHPVYSLYVNPAERPGYSGTALFVNRKTLGGPREIITTLDDPRFDSPSEGRLQQAVFDRAPLPFTLFNIYYPNGQQGDERLDYKMKFYEAFQKRALELLAGKDGAGKNLVIMGDVNTAHNEIDLKNPKENEKNSGFLPVERAWVSRFLECGFKDTYRALHPAEAGYSWWTYRFNARAKNVGWRIDYVFVNNGLYPRVKEAFIDQNVMGSDHCPVGITIDI